MKGKGPTKDDFRVIPGAGPPAQADPARELGPGMPGDAPRCCARTRYCICGHRFAKAERPDHPLASRRQPGFDARRFGQCPECGRNRALCRNFAVRDHHVCRMHGARAGRKPIVPLAALSEESLDAIAALQAARDDSLEREFYVVKHFLQQALATFDPEGDRMAFAERAVALLDRAVGIQERNARLRLTVPSGEGGVSLDFDDPRVALLVKEQMRQQYENAVKGTLSILVEAAVAAGFADQLVSVLPERFRAYVAVRQAAPVEGEVVGGADGRTSEEA